MKRQIPKNVRQIGNVSDSSKIYVEDYVDTFLNQLCEKTQQIPIGAFLVGEIVQEKDEDYIYVYGAIQMKEVTQKGRDIFINDGTWKNACETCKQYFGNAEILGWFLASVGQPLDINHNILKVHQKLFSREKSIFVLKEAREKEEKYFIHKYKDLMECSGHYIYYEKNVEMQDYMIASRKKTGFSPSEIIEDTVTKNFRSVIRSKAEKKEKKGKNRYVYALSTFLVLVVLVMGVAMMKKSLEEDTIETIGNIVKVDGIFGIEENSEPEENVDGQGTAEEPGTTEEPGAVEQLGTTEEPGNAEQPETTEGPGTTEQPGTIDESGAAEEPGTAEEPGITEEQEGSEETKDIYTVQKGDTLATISKKVYGDTTHVSAICELNGLEDGNFILIGQKLLLP